MLTLEDIKARLSDRRIQVVAEATGLHYNTIANVRDAQEPNPNYATLKALSDYFQSQHA